MRVELEIPEPYYKKLLEKAETDNLLEALFKAIKHYLRCNYDI